MLSLPSKIKILWVGGFPLSPPVGKALDIIINLLINLSIVILMNLSWSKFIIIIILFIFQMIVQPYKMFYFSSFKKQVTLPQAHSI